MHCQGVWRCCTTGHGALCVTTIGMLPMPLWCAGGWGIPVAEATQGLDMDRVGDRSGWTTWTAMVTRPP